MRLKPLLITTVLAAICCAALLHAEELTEENYAKWRDYTLPKASEERWRNIPWFPTFNEGVAEAQKAEKPILLWVMNGHPLACT